MREISGDYLSAKAEDRYRESMRKMYDKYTHKLVLLLDAVIAAENLDFKLMWAKHASAIMDKRDLYKEGR
jgi:hypothetical protein